VVLNLAACVFSTQSNAVAIASRRLSSLPVKCPFVYLEAAEADTELRGCSECQSDRILNFVSHCA